MSTPFTVTFRSSPLMETLASSTPRITAPLRSTPVNRAPDRSTARSSAPLRSARSNREPRRSASMKSATLRGWCLRNPHHVARGIAERGVARAPGLVHGLLKHLGAGCPHLLEDPVEVVDTEHDHRQNALGEQFLQGVAVGLGPAGVRLRQHDPEAGLIRAAEGDPAEASRTDVVLHLEPERVAVETE